MPLKFPVPTPADPEDIEVDIYPFIRVFKDGRVERTVGVATVPAGTDPATGVQSKDVILSPEDQVGARLYLPKDAKPEKKLPLVVYFHGGGFCVETAWSPLYHTYLNLLASEANVLVASVNYRLAPEHPIPAAFEDSWRVLKWVVSNSGSGPIGPEPEPTELWLSEYVDFNKVFLCGDSAGGNLSHHMAVRAGEEGLSGAQIDGIIPIHPFFCGVELIGNEADLPEALALHEKIWKVAHPEMTDLDDPVINPVKDLNKPRKVVCGRVLVCVAEKDFLMARGVEYGEAMKRCGKEGLEVEVYRSVQMQHVFHLFDPDCEEAKKLMKKVVEFINGGSANQ